ncbi:sensor histidine kinase [Hymenobacter weizhouensis]|uniref:sensor histidine kinase n=1 Tax=Hymenobacter sp. YIM 151500-1 TaxID=2987689 RepID=UPI0022267533|nr:sensor histidine kinase [Hymenobacter sp. YIM 151500-1]UYZ64953.1 sensor histidine kinase [Hymenobacter sp. YIM 151500-1]
MAHIEAARGNYRAAYRYAEQGAAIERALLSEAKAKALAESQTRYETQQKEQNIKVLTQRNQLLAQRSEVQRLTAERQRVLRNTGFGASALLLVAMGIGYRRYQSRQRLLRLLDAQNQEKTLLLKEVHHRVKNNLQIVLSLLNTQLRRLREPAASHAIRESQSRVQAMALLHQSLYQADSLARVDMNSYLTELVEALRRTFRAETRGVAIELAVAQVELNTHTAVPLGLIVNELLTNAFKYAFPPGHPNKQVRVELTEAGSALYELQVTDNGVGLPEGVDPSTVRSLGLNLVGGLAQQLDATLTVERTNGTSFRIVFTEVAPEAKHIPMAEFS